MHTKELKTNGDLQMYEKGLQCRPRAYLKNKQKYLNNLHVS